MTRRVYLLVLLSLRALAAEPACHREGATVVCTEEGFKTLTDLTIEYKGEAAQAGLRLEACEAKKQALQAALDAAPPATPVATPVKPIVGVAIAAVGAAALATAVSVTMDSKLRLGVGLGGLAAVSAGFVVVILP